MSGLLYGGRLVPVDGCQVISPNQFPWATLGADDYRLRHTKWIRQIILHTTKGIWPQYVRKGAGPAGAGKTVADFWRKDPEHSAAQIVVDRDGTIVCLADLATTCAYHATTSNDWSVGIEMYQEGDGGVFEAVLESTVKLVGELVELFAMPLQICVDPYHNGIVERMKDGGPTCVGIFGHRDQAWKFPWQMTDEQKTRYPQGYAARGRGDPGDEIYRRIIDELNPEQFVYGLDQDRHTWAPRQTKLNAMGERLQVDGVCGPSTVAAMRRHGFKDGRALDAA